MENLKNMSIEELENLKLNIIEEIKSRNNIEKIIYKCEAFGTSNYHTSKYKHWSKKVTSIDIIKTNGYAFIGEFLNINAENLLNKGDFVLELEDDTQLNLYNVQENKQLLLQGNYREIITFIKEAANIVNN